MLKLVAAAGIALAFAGAPAFAQCVDLCAVSCVRPISISDRWDDVTGIPGYMGESSKRPNWRNNSAYDFESFVDLNGNRLWDPGETFTDGNGNGIYDSETYDPLTTGYVAPQDLGLEILLGPSSGSPAPGQYLALAYPPINRGTPVVNDSGAYNDNWLSCAPTIVGLGDACQIQPGSLSGPTNQDMRSLISQDPDAYWDPTTASVQGSAFAQSPRVLFITAHDPRIPLSSGTTSVHVTKVIAFFMEQMEGNAVVRGRLLRAMASGDACAGAGAGFIVECPTPAIGTSWGRVKDLYR